MNLFKKILDKKNDLPDLNIRISYMWQDHYGINVSRSLSLKFRGDVYNYYMLRDSQKVKVYEDFKNEVIELLKDKYQRLWYHVYYNEIFGDRIEETFELVETEKKADTLYKKKGGGRHYEGNLPYFFASENYDFILHEDPMKETPRYIENKREEILQLNK